MSKKIFIVVFAILLMALCGYIVYNNQNKDIKNTVTIITIKPKPVTIPVDTISDITYEGSGTCIMKKWKEWSTDCGGGVPFYKPQCGHWVESQAYSDEDKACVTGKDCCSGACGIGYNNKLSCVASGSCFISYIDKDGNLHNSSCNR